MPIRTESEYDMAKLELDNLRKAKDNIISQLYAIDVWIKETEEKLSRYEVMPKRSWFEGSVALVLDPVTDEVRAVDVPGE